MTAPTAVGARTGYDAQTHRFWAWCRRCDADAVFFDTSAPALRWLLTHDTECPSTTKETTT